MESYICQFIVWRISLSTAISKMVSRLVRHYDQEEQQLDAAVHWSTTRPILVKAFANRRARDYQKQIGFDPSMKEAPRRVSSTRNIVIFTIGKSMCFKGVVLSASNPSLRTNTSKEEGKARKHYRPSSSHLSIVLGKIQMKKHPVMTSRFPRKCTITAIGIVIKMPFFVKIIPSTRANIATLVDDVTRNRRKSCAGRLHQQSDLSVRRWNIVRKALISTTRAGSDT